jgi:hypothetical protein
MIAKKHLAVNSFPREFLLAQAAAETGIILSVSLKKTTSSDKL